jgi:hypothetical protein
VDYVLCVQTLERLQSVVDNFQLEMFEKYGDRRDEYLCADGIVCIRCNVRQPPDQFQHMLSGEIKRKCRTCLRNQSKLVKKLKEEYPYPDEDYKCPICDRDIDEISEHGQKKMQTWVLDHCHGTETFRGWLCFHCNSGLGQFKDSLARIKNAVKYLEEHQNETSS